MPKSIREEVDMRTILVIDDVAHVRMLYTEELQQCGYTVIGSDGTGNPLLLVAEHSPDLIILDIKLGGKSGLDLLQTIRQQHPKLPIILSTAYDSFRFDMKSVAADAYVVKSYDSTELMEKVRALAPL